jgi:large subunit ribosomal protein L23
VYPDATSTPIAAGRRADLQGHRHRVNIHDHPRQKQEEPRQGRPTIGSDYKKAIVTLKTGDKIELV